MNFWLNIINNVLCAFIIILSGKYALETSNMLYSILAWFVVYFTLDIHVYFKNKINNFYFKL